MHCPIGIPKIVKIPLVARLIILVCFAPAEALESNSPSGGSSRFFD